MMYLMQDEILPRLKNAYKLPFIVHKTILTANIGESFLATEIELIENNLPSHIKLAYLTNKALRSCRKRYCFRKGCPRYDGR
jgi:nicotinamide-nucleotide amidase